MTQALTRHRERFEADPADPQTFALLEEVLSRAADWDELIQVYDRHLAATADALEDCARARLLFRRAQAGERCGGAEADARRVDLLREAVALDPTFSPALRDLHRCYAESCQWSALADLLERSAECASTREALRWELELGTVALERLEEPERAGAAFARALALDGEDPAALVGRARALEAANQHDQAADAWVRARAAGAEIPPDAIAPEPTVHDDPRVDEDGGDFLEGDDSDLLADLGDLDTDTWDDGDDALDVDEAPDSAAEATAKPSDEPAGTDDEPLTRGEAAPDFGHDDDPPALETDGDDLGWLEILEQQVTEPDLETSERIDLLMQIGRIQRDRCDDAESARHAFERALAVDALAPAALEELGQLLRKNEDFEALDRVLTRAAEAEPGSADRWCALACLRAGERGDPRGAAVAYEHALGLCPNRTDAIDGWIAAARAGDDTASEMRALAHRGLHGDPAQLSEVVSTFVEREEPEAALPAARRWLEAEPDHPDALRAMAQILGNLAQADELAALLDRAGSSFDADEHAAHRRRLGYLHAAEGHPEKALCAWRAAVTASPDDVASLEAMMQVLAAENRAAEALDLLELHRDRQGSTVEPVRLALHRARALEDGGRFEESMALYTDVREREADSAEALDGLERVARAAGDAEVLVLCLQNRASQANDAGTRDALNFERAILLEERLTRALEAGALYASLAESASHAALAHEAEERLLTILERSGDFVALRDHLVERIDRTPLEERGVLHVRVAELLSGRLHDPDAARDHLRRALAIEPERGDLWERLVGLLEDHGEPRELLATLEATLGSAPSVEDETALRTRAAQVAESLGESERAATHFRAVAAHEPAHPDALRFLADRFESTEDWSAAVSLFEEALAESSVAADAERNVELRVRLARWLDGHLDEGDRATEVLQSIATHDRRAALHLFDLHRSSDRTDDLQALSEEMAEAADGAGEQADWWCRLGDALQHCDTSRAADAYRNALRAEPDRRECLDSLLRVLREAGDATVLAEALEQHLAGASGDRAQALHLELADLFEGPLEEPDRALVHLRCVLESEPENHALRLRAIDRAEACGEIETARLLMSEGLSDPVWSTRADLWQRTAGWLAGPLDQPAEAIEAYETCVRLDASNSETRRALRHLLEQQGRWEEALEWVRHEADRCQGLERIQWLAYGADCAEANLSPSAHHPWLDRLVPLVADDGPLLVAIAAAYIRSGAAPTAERTLEKAVLAETDSVEIAFLHQTRARILERDLGDPARALAALEAAVAHTGPSASQDVDLERLTRRAGRWQRQAEVLERRAQRVRGGARRALLATSARCAFERLGAVERAADLWREVLDDAPSEERARWIREAAAAMQAAGRVRAWALLAEEELEGTTDASRAQQLRRALAQAWAGPLAAPHRALPHARDLADGEAGTAGDVTAHHDLVHLLRRTGRTAELARRLETTLDTAGGDTDAWLELAHIREERLGDPEGAARAYRAALENDTAHADALAGLRRCCERLRLWSETITTLERQIAAGTVDPASAWLRVGALQWRERDDREAATRSFETALELDPTSLGAVRGLQETARAAQAWHRVRDLLVAEGDSLGTNDPARSHALWLEVAALCRGPIPDDRRAAEAYEAASALGPLDAEQQAAWAACLDRSGETARWIEVFGAWCDRPDATTAADDQLRLARALLERGSLEAAQARLALVLERAPTYVRGWETAAELCERASDRAGAVDAWTRAGECGEAASAAESFVRAAALLDGDHAERAADLLERALERDPSSAEGQARMAWVAGVLGRSKRCATSAARLLALTSRAAALTPELRRGAWIQGAQAACQLEQWANAAALASAVLEEDPRQSDALAAGGVAAFYLDDPDTCQQRLGARLERAATPAERAEWLSLRGAALEVGAHWEESLACHQEALSLENALPRAHAGCARCLERLQKTAEAAEAHAAWAACGGEGAGDRWLRAARLADSDAPVETWLRAALEAEPDHAAARLELARLLWDAERRDDAFTVASEGADRVRDPAVASALETLRGRVLETRQCREEALDAYQRAAALDAEGCEAALAAGRLLSAAGQWNDAADLLGSFAERHRDPAGCAELFVQRARLLAGVLEDLDGAEAAYRRACELAPERADARDALGSLLAHLPHRGQDAASVHRQILAETPQRSASIRALMRIADREGDRDRARRGATLLRALGVETASERDTSDASIDFAVAARAPRASAPGESQRRALLEATPYLAALNAVPSSTEGAVPDAGGPAADALRAVEAEVFGASGWLHCDPEQLRRVLVILREATARTPGQDEVAQRLRDGLDSSAARRIRRLLGRGDGPEADFDAGRWQTEARSRAAALAVDRLSGALRPVLRTLVGLDDEGREGAIESQIADCPEARHLLTRVLEAWLES